MKIDLSNLTIEASLKPFRKFKNNGRKWEDYFNIKGLINGTYVGRINISRGLNMTGRYNDNFFLDITKNPPIPKPYVCWQETIEEFRGNGICGKIILLANEFYKGKLGTTLYSDTHFIHSFRESSKRVWEKLTNEGLAIFEPYITEEGEKQDRWFIK